MAHNYGATLRNLGPPGRNIVEGIDLKLLAGLNPNDGETLENWSVESVGTHPRFANSSRCLAGGSHSMADDSCHEIAKREEVKGGNKEKR